VSADPFQKFDPYEHDPARWGASMVHHARLLLAVLDAVGAQSVIEVGAYAGDLTRVIAAWAETSGASVTAVDPAPQEQLVQLAADHEGLELVRKTSLEAIPQLPVPDVYIIDGDHNYYTVSRELELIAETSRDTALPLLLFHDVCWPHGRRDDYFDPEQIPADYRHPIAGPGAGIFPGDSGTRPDGLPYPKSAATEAGPRNGVLTAVEDFVSGREGVRLVIVPAFFGFGAAWQTDAPWADRVAAVLDPWDRNELVAGLEASRVFHIAESYSKNVALWKAQDRLGRQDVVLRRLLVSSAFRVAEGLSKLRDRFGIANEQSVVSREEIRRSLPD
jgi:Methyltransferase domain